MTKAVYLALISTMAASLRYRFTADVWLHDPSGGWHFVSLPAELSTEIRAALKAEEEGWGRLKVRAKLYDFEWQTAIWFDTKRGTYLLPLKAEVRKKAAILVGDAVDLVLVI